MSKVSLYLLIVVLAALVAFTLDTSSRQRIAVAKLAMTLNQSTTQLQIYQRMLSYQEKTLVPKKVAHRAALRHMEESYAFILDQCVTRCVGNESYLERIANKAVQGWLQKAENSHGMCWMAANTKTKH
jgi:hypothetical protein